MDKVQIYASDALKGTVWGNIADALSMATGGIITGLILHPSDTLKVMKNKFNGDYTMEKLYNNMDIVFNSYPACILEIVMFIISFEFFYGSYRDIYYRIFNRNFLTVRANLLVGMFAGACTQIVSCPFKTVAVQMQAGNYNSTIDACRGIYYSSTGGSFKNFYHGLKVGIILSSINPAIDYTLYNQISNIIVNSTPSLKGDIRNMSNLSVFLLGIFSKTCSASLTYPMTTLKIKTQAQGKGHQQKKKSTTKLQNQKKNVENNTIQVVVETTTRQRRRQLTSFEIFQNILKNEGFFVLYSGFMIKILNTAAKAGVKRVIKANIRETIFSFMFQFLQFFQTTSSKS